MSFIVTLWVALGSAIGGVARHLCSELVARTYGDAFPWATLGVNVIGSLLIGAIATLTGAEGKWLVPLEARQFVMTGMLGGFTTFSAFSLQTLTLWQEGEWFLAGANIMASLGLCLGGVWLGHLAALALNR